MDIVADKCVGAISFVSCVFDGWSGLLQSTPFNFLLDGPLRRHILCNTCTDSDARTAQNCKMLSGIVAGTIADIYFNVKGVPHIEMVFCVTKACLHKTLHGHYASVGQTMGVIAYRHTFLLFQ